MFSAKIKITILVTLHAILISGLSVFGDEDVHFDYSYRAADSVKIILGKSECVVTRGYSRKIEVRLIFDDPEDYYKPQANLQGDTLVLSENHNEKSKWLVSIPGSTTINIVTFSGDLFVEGLKSGIDLSTTLGDIFIKDTSGSININTMTGDTLIENCKGNISAQTLSGDIGLNSIIGDIDVNSASGDIRFYSISGDLDANTASGDIRGNDLSGIIVANSASGEMKIVSSKGIFTINSATGDSHLSNIEINGASSFNSYSGSVLLELARSSNVDLSLNSFSGDVELNYHGNPFLGEFTFLAWEGRGRILSKHPFDLETMFYSGGISYEKKVFTVGNDSPEIILSTASGKAILK